MRSTHTYALLEVPKEMVELVKEKLINAGYQHAIHEDDGKVRIDMQGIGLCAEGETY